MAEWSIAPVLKTGKGKPFVSSNLTASASKNKHLAQFSAVQSKLELVVIEQDVDSVSVPRIPKGKDGGAAEGALSALTKGL